MIIAQGAEATINLKNNLIFKQRTKKNYRIPLIDEKLRKQRTKREAKILKKLYSSEVLVPKIIEIKDYEIIMEYLEGSILKNILDDNIILAKKIGQTVAKMHDLMIAHQDLTTSNILLKNNQIYLIDFGLAFHTRRYEDFAVDLHIFKQALESKHHKIFKQAMKEFWKGYNPENLDLIKERFYLVEKRGRNKLKC